MAHVYQNNRASVKATRSNVLAYLLVTRARGSCPQSYIFIIAAKGARQPIISVKRQTINPIGRARQHPDQLSSVYIPGSNRRVTWATRQNVIAIERESINPTGVASQSVDKTPVIWIPQLYRRITRSAG